MSGMKLPTGSEQHIKLMIGQGVAQITQVREGAWAVTADVTTVAACSQPEANWETTMGSTIILVVAACEL